MDKASQFPQPLSSRAQSRRLKSCYLGLGSNLQSPARQIERAYQLLSNHGVLKLCSCSSFYQSTAMVLRDHDVQADYVNAVMRGRTSTHPLGLLALIKRMEGRLGRPSRSRQWGPRIIDIDLLWMENVSLRTPILTLPHPGLMKRTFVLLPLAELNPRFILPNNIKITDHLATIKDQWNVCHLSASPRNEDTPQAPPS